MEVVAESPELVEKVLHPFVGLGAVVAREVARDVQAVMGRERVEQFLLAGAAGQRAGCGQVEGVVGGHVGWGRWRFGWSGHAMHGPWRGRGGNGAFDRAVPAGRRLLCGSQGGAMAWGALGECVREEAQR